MKILIVTQYFWPENFQINDFALGLVSKGNEVNILTGIPNYPKGKIYENYTFWGNNDETWNGVKIFRSKLIPRGKGGGFRLMLNYLSFALFGLIKAFFLKEKYDAILVYEPSPVTCGIPAIVLKKKKKIPIFFWVQDLWPESVVAAGDIHNPIILGLLDRLTKWIYKNSDKLLIQSKGFRNYLSEQNVPDAKIIYFPNTTATFYKPITPSEDVANKLKNYPFVITFAGNIGESQDFDTIIDAAHILKNKSSDIHFAILGDGRKKEYAIDRIRKLQLSDNFHFLGSFPATKMPHFFAASDALLVSLKYQRIFSLTIPSKVQSYLACGKPIIGSLSGAGAEVIEESGAGYVSTPGDSKQLADKIYEVFQLDKQSLENLGTNARSYFESNFERDMLLNRLIDLFKGKKVV
jgi:glycosyltransferase involved in cell wall biosynthesis